MVFGHYQYTSEIPLWFSSTKSYLYSFHMQTFMLLSGFLYSLSSGASKTPYLTFVKNKAMRLLLPFYSFTLLGIGAKFVLQNMIYVKNEISIDTLARSLYFPTVNFSLWFLLVLFVFFTIVPFFVSRLSRLALLSVSLLLFCWAPSLPDFYCLNLAPGMFVYFCLGLVAGGYKEYFDKVINSPWWILTASSLAGFFLLGKSNNPLIEISFALLSAAALCSASLAISKNKSILANAIFYIAPASFTVYMLHSGILMLGVAAIKTPALSVLSDSNIMSILMPFAMTILAVCFSICAYRLIFRRSRLLSLILLGERHKQ